MTDFELRQKQIEIQLAEYEKAIDAAVAWYEQWKNRQQTRGFRCQERQQQRS